MSDKPAFIHHVNFPTTDPERTIEWYTKVFGMKYIKPKSNTKVVLMTRGNFDLHFTPVEEMDRMAPYHFAVEVEDWDGFLEHLAKLGIRHTRVITRPENNSQFCYIHDPDHTMIELVFHERRPYPPVPKKEAASAAAPADSAGSAGRRRVGRQASRGAGARRAGRHRGAVTRHGHRCSPATPRSTTRSTGRARPCCSCTVLAGTTPPGGSRSPRCPPTYTVITIDLRGFGNSRWEVRPRRAQLPRRHHRRARRDRDRRRSATRGARRPVDRRGRRAAGRPEQARPCVGGHPRPLARRPAPRGTHRPGQGRPAR